MNIPVVRSKVELAELAMNTMPRPAL
eukprot:COSAG02_NODE_77721_length_123_cov_21.375000_1_plen_25_part_01